MKRGDVVYVHTGRKSDPLRETTVTSVGPKFITTALGHRFRSQQHTDGYYPGEYGQSLWLSPESRETHMRADRLRLKIRDTIYSAPPKLIESVAALLGVTDDIPRP